MQDSYSIELDRMEETVKKVVEAGYSVMVVINGEYYDINMNEAEKAGKER